MAKLTLEERFWAKVNKTESCWLWTASCRTDGYGQQQTPDGNKAAHRFSYELARGPIPDGLNVDHMCHVKTCVNPTHLRACTTKQNLEHRQGAQARNRSGVRGVTWNAARQKWYACVVHNYKTYSCGRFETIEEAAAAVSAKRIELFTHNLHDRQGNTA